MKACPHVHLTKCRVGHVEWYECDNCQQKFHLPDKWDGKVKVTAGQ